MNIQTTPAIERIKAERMKAWAVMNASQKQTPKRDIIDLNREKRVADAKRVYETATEILKGMEEL